MQIVEAASPRPVKIVVHTVVHMHAKPSRDAERVSQTLLGRLAEVITVDGDWSYVQTDDAYRGWVENRWLADPPADAARVPVCTVFGEVRTDPFPSAPLVERVSILGGVYLPPAVPYQGVLDGWRYVTLPGGAKGWIAEASVAPLPDAPPPAAVGAHAARWGREFRGTPYLWGGSSSFGLDCSGYVQICYRLVGITLRRDADIQRDDPRFVPVEHKDLAPGDLVFFGKPDRITHVGMHLEGNQFLHSAGGAGVIVSEWGDDRYSPSYVDARRLDPARAAEPVTRYESETR